MTSKSITRSKGASNENSITENVGKMWSFWTAFWTVFVGRKMGVRLYEVDGMDVGVKVGNGVRVGKVPLSSHWMSTPYNARCSQVSSGT